MPDVLVRETIFDSKAEQELFHELDSRLNPRLRLMAQTPLRSLIELDAATRQALKERHRRYFLQAVVDYTFVYPDGRPLLSIEFDGIGGGFSRGRQYIPCRKTGDPRREWKLTFKLRAAARAHYPLFVISADELEHLDEGGALMIVDGIVGQIFSRVEERRIIDELLESDAELLAKMDRGQAHEHVQDLVLQAGVIADLEFDELAIATAREQQRCHERFGFGFGGFGSPWLYDPPLPADVEMTAEGIGRRRAAMEAADRVGALVGVAAGNGEYICATAWMRNVGQDHGLIPELVAEQVAEYLAIRRAIRLAEEGRVAECTEPAPFDRPNRLAAH